MKKWRGNEFVLFVFSLLYISVNPLKPNQKEQDANIVETKLGYFDWKKKQQQQKTLLKCNLL